MAKKENKSEVEVLDDDNKKPHEDIGGTASEDLNAATKSTALVSYEDQLAEFAQEAAESESIVGTFLSTKNGRLAINGNPVAGNKLDCIVSAFCMENAFYPGKFDPNNPAPPRCYAFGAGNSDEGDMRPHPDVKDPVNSDCATCPNNQWKSDGEKGKLCKNIRRLALLPADCVNDPSKIVSTERIYFKIPVTSVKDWSKYVHGVATEFKRPPFGVVTQLSAVPDDKTQFKSTFKCMGKVSNEAIGALIEAHKVDEASIDFPYPADNNAAAASAKDSEKF